MQRIKTSIAFLNLDVKGHEEGVFFNPMYVLKRAMAFYPLLIAVIMNSMEHKKLMKYVELFSHFDRLLPMTYWKTDV